MAGAVHKFLTVTLSEPNSRLRGFINADCTHPDDEIRPVYHPLCNHQFLPVTPRHVKVSGRGEQWKRSLPVLSKRSTVGNERTFGIVLDHHRPLPPFTFRWVQYAPRR